MRRLGDAADVSFTPGNHDAYVRDALPVLAETFAPWTEGYRFPYLRRRGEVALIGLNTGVRPRRCSPLAASAPHSSRRWRRCCARRRGSPGW